MLHLTDMIQVSDCLSIPVESLDRYVIQNYMSNNFKAYIKICMWLASCEPHKHTLWYYATTLDEEEEDTMYVNYSSLEDDDKMILLLRRISNLRVIFC